jgi:hypothetical protein
MRACALFAIHHNVYTGVSHEASKKIMEKIYGICFLPEQYIKVAIDIIEEDIPSDPITQSFGKELIKYFRVNWLRRNIR